VVQNIVPDKLLPSDTFDTELVSEMVFDTLKADARSFPSLPGNDITLHHCFSHCFNAVAVRVLGPITGTYF